MAASMGTLLYFRGQNESEGDMWDDTELIMAYDKAKGKVREKIGLPNSAFDNESIITESTSSLDQSGLDGSQRRRKKKHKKKNKNKQHHHHQWNIGDACRARFEEDMILYEATLVDIIGHEGVGLVKFVGYNNVQKTRLKDLLPSNGEEARQLQHLSIQNNVMTLQNDDCDSESTSSEATSSRAMPPNFSEATSSKSKPHNFKGPQQPWIIPPPPPPVPPLLGPHAGPYLGPNPQWAGSMFGGLQMPTLTNLPTIPPMPPPMSVGSNFDPDNESLASMLISWYVSGYHTGYYMGLQKGRKRNRGGNSVMNTIPET